MRDGIKLLVGTEKEWNEFSKEKVFSDSFEMRQFKMYDFVRDLEKCVEQKMHVIVYLR